MPWIMPLPGTPMRTRLDAEFAAAGLPSPPNPIESVSLLINEKLLQDTDMISVVSLQLARHYERSGALAVLPLKMSHALGPVGLLWIDAVPTAAVGRFLDAVRSEARRLAPERIPSGIARAAGRTITNAAYNPKI
jgi:DNA-binding transcriptional LysR family regulator